MSDRNENERNRNDMRREGTNDRDDMRDETQRTSGRQDAERGRQGMGMENDRTGSEGRHDGGRYDTGRFGGDFYEGGRHEGSGREGMGLGGRYDAERYGQGGRDFQGYGGGSQQGYGGSQRGFGGGYGSDRGGYGMSQGGGFERSDFGGGYGTGSYGGSSFDRGYGGGYGGYGGGYGEFRGSDMGYGRGSYGSYGSYGRQHMDQHMHEHDRDREGGGMPWMLAAGAAAIAAVGGYALYRTTMGNRHDRQGRSRWKGIHVEESVTINKPVAEIYRHWSNLENLGSILSHVEKVEMLPNGRSKWTAKGPAGTKVEWEAETVQDIENERITWRSLPGADVPNEGSVWFQERSGGRGSEVHVSLMYHPPGGALSAGLAGLLGEEPHQQIAHDLRNFKQKLEAGETIGDAHKNPSGRSSGKQG